jgi:hypothetical protein
MEMKTITMIQRIIEFKNLIEIVINHSLEEGKIEMNENKET